MATTDEGGSTLGDETSESRKGWAEASACAYCGSAFSKRYLNPRHHCRVCGNSVCSNCSPSSIKLEGEKALQRVCTPCVANVQLAPSFQERLTHLGSSLRAISSGEVLEEPKSLEESIHLCESLVTSLEDLRDGHQAQKSQLEGSKLKLDAASAKLAGTVEERDQLLKELTDVRANLSAREGHISHLEEEQAALKASLAEQKERVSEFEQRREELEGKLSALQQELGEARLKVIEEEARRSALEAALEVKDVEHLELQQAHASLGEENRNLQEKADAAARESSEASQRAADLRVKLSEVEFGHRKVTSGVAAAEAAKEAQAALSAAQQEAAEQRRGRRHAEEALQTALTSSKRLGEQLHALAGVEAPSPETLPEALTFCASALPYLQAQAQAVSPDRPASRSSVSHVSMDRSESLLQPGTLARPSCIDRCQQSCAIA
ncbi:unnamed protein product [Effrenium voratum]|uniref:FYVE-type domain-containing protein n=1 Tax=Effrenium voratum TaxID=2562239 RepID=A0AA36HPT5_9DINO|nr:unnamed protein product [Effrenium voratum]CAJ1420909.1 unnamed protein product [Effrenium voratum]